MPAPTDPAKAWLAEFLFVRGHFNGPTGQPLYQYQVEAREYAALSELLQRHREQRSHFLFSSTWASTFCLYVAERFRRDYDGSDEGWSWIPIERALGCSLNGPSDRAELVKQGLSYWKRPIREYAESGLRSWLGSLALEGGLPWPLVQSDRHGFGRAVRRGLKYHYRTDGGRITTADLIADVEDSLPKLFRNLDTRHLLAGVVEQLMTLVKRHSLSNVDDPAAYLDERERRWRDAFPIPLDENNARTLVNEWLRDADKSNRGRAEALARERTFSSSHRLIGFPIDWRILTEVTLPLEDTVPVALDRLRGTRLAVTIHEGETVVGRGRTAYARLDGNTLIVPYPAPTTISIERKNLAEPISLRLSESGQTIYSHIFDGSQFDLNETPLVFENRADQWWLCATASCRLHSKAVRVRIPPNATVEGAQFCESGRDQLGGRWIEASRDLMVAVGSERYSVRLSTESSALAQPQLKGDLCSLQSTPSTVYLGKPMLDVPANANYGRADLLEFENGRPALAGSAQSRAGAVRYTVRTRDGETVMVRRFGILPKGFRVQGFAAMSDRPATLVLQSARGLECRVTNEGVSAKFEAQDDALRIQLLCRLPQPPPHVNLEIASQGYREPILIRVPYPLIGARLIDAAGAVAELPALTTGDLLGTRLVLLSSRPQDFYLVFKLNSAGKLSIKRHYRVRVNDQPVSVGLFDYLQDIRQMLGCVSEQHATVRLQIETDREWRRLDIGRYRGYLDTGAGGMMVRDAGVPQGNVGVEVEAVSIVDPAREPIRVPERLSEGVRTGVFIVPAELERDGPWVLCASKQSQIRFAPKLYSGAIAQSEGVAPLQLAVRQFHPDRNPLAIDPHIVDMAADPDHGGWQYLHLLRKRCDHLPLSTFAAWQAMARNESALAVALIRLELDAETCQRMRDELAVIWESIPLKGWIDAFRQCRVWLLEQGLQSLYADSFLENRILVLKSLVPSFERITGLVRDGKMEALPQTGWVIVEHLLRSSYERLRRDHSDDERWPTDLSQQLAEWISRQKVLPGTLARLANVEYVRAVTYLPIFMACVTAGKAKCSDLGGPLVYVKFALRTVSEFDWRGWYLPVHDLVLAYLVAQDGTRA